MPSVHDFPEGQDETLRRMAGADRYNAWLIDRSRQYLGARVLDLGSGIGTFTSMIAERADQVVALEPDPVFWSTLRRRFAQTPNVEVMPVDVSALTSDSIGHDFNTIVCFNVLEHIADDREALVAMRATLLPDGYLLLLVPAHPALYGGIDRTVAHVRRYSRRPLADLLRESGFAVEVMRHVNPIGAAGWLVAGRLLGRTQVPQGPLMLYDRLVPLLRQFDLVDLHVGLSLWVVARRLA